MDEVFRALADPSRRRLLDGLNQRNGQSLRELCAGLDMTRQSVSKHLAVLADANLVAVVWRGREKLHYLNAAPISEIVSKAQHCRAEVFLSGFGWVPVDPADVRKVALEEPPGQLALEDPKVVAARKTLFGAWEMNWLAYNFAHDVELPGSTGPKVGFLMYPQAEVDGERLDALDPDSFKYVIKAKEISA